MISSNPAIELHRNVVILETLHVVHHTRGIVGELKPIASIVSLKLNAMREGIDGPIWGFELVDFKLLGHTKLSEIILHMGVAGRRVFIYFKLNKCSPLTDWQVILFLQRKNNKRQLKKKTSQCRQEKLWWHRRMNPRRHASFGYFAASLGPGTPFRFASSMPWRRNHDGPSVYLSRSVCVGTPNPGSWNCDKLLNYKRSGHCLHFCFCTLCQEESKRNPHRKKRTPS